jgi:hypothetical protein
MAKSRRMVGEMGETDYCALPLQLNDSFNNNVMIKLDNKSPKEKQVSGVYCLGCKKFWPEGGRMIKESDWVYVCMYVCMYFGLEQS